MADRKRFLFFRCSKSILPLKTNVLRPPQMIWVGVSAGHRHTRLQSGRRIKRRRVAECVGPLSQPIGLTFSNELKPSNIWTIFWRLERKWTSPMNYWPASINVFKESKWVGISRRLSFLQETVYRLSQVFRSIAWLVHFCRNNSMRWMNIFYIPKFDFFKKYFFKIFKLSCNISCGR